MLYMLKPGSICPKRIESTLKTKYEKEKKLDLNSQIPLNISSTAKRDIFNSHRHPEHLAAFFF